jgi:hypothetical protein
MSYIEEVSEAAKGCLAILRGDRDAPEYFDLTLHGLVGSLIALVVMMAAQAQLPVDSSEPGVVLNPLAEILLVSAAIAVWAVVLYYFLRFTGRLDRFVPFLVVYNWGNVFAAVIWLVLALLGIANLFVTLVIGVVSIYFFVRAAIVIMGLSLAMIAGLFVAELLAFSLAVALLGALLPTQ